MFHGRWWEAYLEIEFEAGSSARLLGTRRREAAPPAAALRSLQAVLAPLETRGSGQERLVPGVEVLGGQPGPSVSPPRLPGRARRSSSPLGWLAVRQTLSLTRISGWGRVPAGSLLFFPFSGSRLPGGQASNLSPVGNPSPQENGRNSSQGCACPAPGVTLQWSQDRWAWHPGAGGGNLHTSHCWGLTEV